MFGRLGLDPGVFNGKAWPSDATFKTKKSQKQIKNASCSKKIIEILVTKNKKFN